MNGIVLLPMVYLWMCMHVCIIILTFPFSNSNFKINAKKKEEDNLFVFKKLILD